MSPTLASAPGSCCFSGVKHIGTPVGRVEDLGGIPTYISDPPAATQKVILFLADVWSPLFVNNKLVQDYFASCGYVVLGPDYFFGDSAPNHDGPDRQEWIDNSRKPAIDAFPAWLDAVKGKYGMLVCFQSLLSHPNMYREGEYQILCCRYVNTRIAPKDAKFL